MISFLNQIERADAEELALNIIENEKTNVTEKMVREWSDTDLLEWLAAWNCRWALMKLVEHE